MQKWQPLPIPSLDKPEAYRLAMRLNALGSLYFFVKFVLQRRKLTETLHKPILERLEQDVPRYLIELPRDHYKTTMVTEGRNMWRVLPFNERDEVCMRELGYDDEFIAWMKRAHDPSRRILIVSEVLSNAIKFGTRIDWHYKENSLFRWLFPEIIPDVKETWTNESKQQKCTARGPQGEGTFDFIGVGGALQSRHYTDVDEDDPVGRDALESEIVMEKTIQYHQLLIGAFESFHTGTWTVVNNRWAPNDLSGWIRKNQPEFVIEHHSAEGGCCEAHPNGEPIFPEEFSKKTLAEIRRIQGPYLYSHQFLNLPVNPEECIFKPEWLRFYAATKSPVDPITTFADPYGKQKNRSWLRHMAFGQAPPLKDLDPNVLVRSMIVDPNHAEERGRCHHAIVVTGLNPETDNIYLLDVWAQSASYDALTENIYKMAARWNLLEFWLETVAAQRILKYHIEYRNKHVKPEKGERRLTVRELKSDRGANAKRVRIESLEPVLREGRLWVREDQSEFLDEYYDYPSGRTVDVLDCLGYAPQTWNAIHAKSIMKSIDARRQKYKGRSSRTGY
jgi:hypothetical protein